MNLVHPGTDEADGRLALEEFEQKFGEVKACSIAFATATDDSRPCVLNSALTRSKYIAYDWSACVYTVTPR